MAPRHVWEVDVMTYEYWMIKCGEEYYAGSAFGTWTSERLNAARYLKLKPARDRARMLRRIGDDVRVVHVRIRPRSERLYLTDRLKAWEPVVKAAVGYMSTAGIVNGKLAEVAKACAALPPEHRP